MTTSNDPLPSQTVDQHGMRVTIILDHPSQSTDFRICRFAENGYHPGDAIAVAADKRLALVIANCLNLHDELVQALADLSRLVESDYVGEEGRTVREQAKALLAKAKGEA